MIFCNTKYEGTEIVESINNIQCTELWNKVEPDLRKMCKVKLQSSPNDIDDVISEAFLALCKRISENGWPENPSAWLYGTVNNLIKLKHRKLQKEKEKVISITDKEYEIPLDYDFTEQIEDNLMIEMLECDIEKQLSEQEKMLLRFIYIDKLKMKEIAKILHTTETAVKQKHYRLCRHICETVKKKI